MRTKRGETRGVRHAASIGVDTTASGYLLWFVGSFGSWRTKKQRRHVERTLNGWRRTTNEQQRNGASTLQKEGTMQAGEKERKRRDKL